MSTAARRAHTRAIRRRHERRPGQVEVTISCDTTRAIRQLADAHRLLTLAAGRDHQAFHELAEQLRRANEAERLNGLRFLARIDPTVHVYTATVPTPTGTECRVFAKRLGGWAKDAPSP